MNHVQKMRRSAIQCPDCAGVALRSMASMTKQALRQARANTARAANGAASTAARDGPSSPMDSVLSPTHRSDACAKAPGRPPSVRQTDSHVNTDMSASFVVPDVAMDSAVAPAAAHQAGMHLLSSKRGWPSPLRTGRVHHADEQREGVIGDLRCTHSVQTATSYANTHAISSSFSQSRPSAEALVGQAEGVPQPVQQDDGSRPWVVGADSDSSIRGSDSGSPPNDRALEALRGSGHLSEVPASDHECCGVDTPDMDADLKMLRQVFLQGLEDESTARGQGAKAVVPLI